MSRQRQLLTAEAASALQAAELQEQDGPLRGRLQAVRLYGLGYPTREIQTITGCSRSRLMEWYRAYQQAGMAALADQRVGGNNHKLTPAQRADLRDALRQYTPRSLFGNEATTPSGRYGKVDTDGSQRTERRTADAVQEMRQSQHGQERPYQARTPTVSLSGLWRVYDQRFL